MTVPADTLPLKGGPGIDLLEGVVVIDLTTSIAGPYAGQLLADLGATVIKVERPGRGDDARAWGPPFLDGESLWFQSVNRNKQSLALDFTDSRGMEVLRGLVRRADAVLVNLVEAAQARLGIDAQSLGAIRDGLIHVSITGFGLTGARSDLPCYDLIAEGYSGVMDMTGEADGPAQKVGTPAADLLAGEDAAMATIAALYRKQRTGKGANIDISMVESMARFMSPRILPYLGSGDLLRRSGGRDSVIAIYQAFDTADEPITLGLGNDSIWKRFWNAVGQPDRAAAPGFEDNQSRRERRASIVDEISSVLRARTREEWLETFRSARVPAGPINRIDQIAEDPELQARGFVYAIERQGTRIPQIGLGITIDGATETASTPPPRLGEHSRQVLRDLLELNRSEIDALSADGVIEG
jgi:crotonobetainyl-CoA:carnitine CoA-transferase CaiB-like acyl-CoA transferase